MSHEPAIDLTPGELASVEKFATQHGMTTEDAAVLLGRKAIQTYFVLPKKPTAVLPFGALKRE